MALSTTRRAIQRADSAAVVTAGDELTVVHKPDHDISVTIMLPTAEAKPWIVEIFTDPAPIWKYSGTLGQM